MAGKQPQTIANYGQQTQSPHPWRPERRAGLSPATAARFDKRERHIIFEWIKIRSDVIMQQMDKADHRSLDAAWRHAMETGLRCQNLISLTTNQKCHPNYNSNRYH